MSPPRPLPLKHRPSRWLAALLVLALLYVQALGQAHRALHPQLVAHQGSGLAHGATSPAGPSAIANAASHARNTLFGHEQHAEECRLFDQLSLGDLTLVAAAAAHALPLADRADAPVLASPGGASRLAYQARGPPPIRS